MSADRGDLLGGRFEIGCQIAVQGPEDCRHAMCTRRPDGRCVGYHCAACGRPSSYQGHYTRVAWWGDPPVYFPDDAWYFSCSPEFTEAVERLRAETEVSS